MFRFPKAHSLDYKQDKTSSYAQLVYKAKKNGFKHAANLPLDKLKEIASKNLYSGRLRQLFSK